MNRSVFTVVLAPPFNPTVDWDRLPEDDAVLQIRTLPLLTAAVETALHRGIEIARVIFDQSVTADEYLSFLATISPLHRADVVMIQPSGDGYISAVTRHEGRVLYHVSAADLAFYLQTNYTNPALRLAS